jgi:hypothetical protein
MYRLRHAGNMGGDANIDGHLIYIPPSDLRKVWDVVKSGLMEVRKHTDEPWIPEDIYTELKNGTATLHIEKDGGGFVVLQKTPQYDGVALHIWAAYSEGLEPLETYIAEIEQMARNIGAKRLTLSSKRNWRKYFEPVIYKKELL